ncbi:MAG: V-type ATPase subunit [Clostridiales bacterium]|jgi:V/A-type H+-transporting ATPase subunit C|nr:V-type ATPase subunit [Clostridiales bacterium]
MNYSGVNAKVKTMVGHLISHREYAGLCEIKSVGDLGMSLKNRIGYRHALGAISEEEMRRSPVERKIGVSLRNDIVRTYSFVNDNNIKKFLKCVCMKNEIRIVQLLLGMAYDERDIAYSMSEISDFLTYDGVNAKRIADARGVKELIDALEGTPYHKTLLAVYNENSTLFELETQLDLFYYLRLAKARDMFLDKTNREVVHKLKGAEADLRNLIWIYRIKKSYGMAPSMIYAHIIPYHYKIKRERMSRLIEASGVDELREEIRGTPYAGFPESDRPEADLFRRMAKLYASTAIMRPDSLAATLRYIFLKETELNNLISVVEGVRYGLEPAEIMKYVMDGGEERGLG